MDTFTSFHASAVAPDKLSGIISDYLALERARIFRRLLVTRFGLFALVAAIAGLWHWVSLIASSVSIGIFLVPPVWACLFEWRCRRRFAGWVNDLPGVTHEVCSTLPVRKS